MLRPNTFNLQAFRRVINLWGIAIASGQRRIRHDLAAEAVAMICVAILLATFFYVFNDFINSQVKDLSPALQTFLAEWFARILLLACGIAGGASLSRSLKDANNLYACAKRNGETPDVLNIFQIGKVCAWLLLTIGLSTHIVAEFFPVIGTQLQFLYRVLFGGLGVGIGIIGGMHWKRTPPSRPASNQNRHQKNAIETRSFTESQATTLAKWRFRQIIRSPAGKLLAGTAFLLFCVGGWSSFRRQPEFVAIICAWAGGFVLACTIPLQVRTDLDAATMERTAGISHTQYLAGLNRLAWMLAIPTGLLAGLLMIPLGIGALKSIAIAALPAVIIPSLVFQIDARKPTVTVLASLIITLFIATAIFAHWLSIILLPLLSYYANQMQAKRFHRA